MPKGFDNLLTILIAAVLLTWLVLYLRPDMPPDSQLETAVSMVREAQDLLATRNMPDALDAFEREAVYKADNVDFFLLDKSGENIYHAADRTLIGRNFVRGTDEDNRPFSQTLISETTSEGVWHSVHMPTGWHFVYARKARHGQIIAASFSVPH